MAVSRENETNALKIYVSSSAGEKYVRSFSSANPAISDADAYEVVAGLASLQKHDVSRYARTSYAEIIGG